MDKQTISLIMSGLALVIAVVVLVLHGMQHWFHSAGDHVIACVHKGDATWPTDGDYKVTEDTTSTDKKLVVNIDHENDKVKFAQVFDAKGNALNVETTNSEEKKLTLTLAAGTDTNNAATFVQPKHIILFSD